MGFSRTARPCPAAVCEGVASTSAIFHLALVHVNDLSGSVRDVSTSGMKVDGLQPLAFGCMARYHFIMDSTRKQILQLTHARRALPPPERRAELRKAAHLRLKDMADAVGVSVTTVWHWEHGLTEPSGARRDAYLAALQALGDPTQEAS